MSFLGLDIGTSAVKAIIVNEAGEAVATATAPLTSEQPRPGWSEQHAEHWLQAVLQCCDQIRDAYGQQWQQLQAIGLSGQMHGATLLGDDQRPLRPAILWNDSRSAAQCDEINQRVADIETRAGIFAMPGFTAPKVLWCEANEPSIYRRIAHVLLPKDYLRLALCGEMLSDCADAGGTLWMNQASRQWDATLCEASHSDRDWLPKITEGTEVAGRLRPAMAARLGLPANIPISAGGGDAAAGALGIGAIGQADAFASLGTSGQLFVSTDSYQPAPGSVLHCYAHCVPERWFQMACMLNGASPMQWFSALANKPIQALLDEAETAQTAPLFLPYLSGERTPHNDRHIRGCFYGLDPKSDDASCMRAVVEAIAYAFCDANDCLKSAGTQLAHIAAIGGGARSDFVLQTMADALSISIHRYRDAALGPALGAARTAMVASGAYRLDEVAKKPKLERVFEPRPSQRDYHHEKHQRWRALYRCLQPFAALDQPQKEFEK